MILDIDDIEIVKFKGKGAVRISMGGYMYMETPFTTEENAQVIYDNIMRRVK